VSEKTGAIWMDYTSEVHAIIADRIEVELRAVHVWYGLHDGSRYF
jgi:hypothetical protein